MQVPLYAVNQYLVADKLQALDIGGSITIHAFGAYYGLAASWALAKPGTGNFNVVALSTQVRVLCAT